jgi:hypothetical protein
MTSRLHSVRLPDGSLDVTRLTIMCFGPSFIGVLVVSALFLVKVW